MRRLLLGLLPLMALAARAAVVESDFAGWPAGLAPRGQYPPQTIAVIDGVLRITDDDPTAYYGAGWNLHLPLPASYRLRWRQRLPADGYGGLVLGGEGEIVHLGIGQAADAADLLLETGPDGAAHAYQTAHPLGRREDWHAFDLRLDGDRLRLAVDGREVADRAFSGAPVNSFWFWSGQRSVGATEVDDVRLEADLPEAAEDRLDVDFDQPGATAGWRDTGRVIGGLGSHVSEPWAGYLIDFREQPKWTLTSPLLTLVPGRSYRLALRFRAMNQPMSFEVTLASPAAPRPLASLTSRETRDQLRELVVDFPSGTEPLTAGVVIRSTGGGGTLTLHHLSVVPLEQPIAPYTTGYGLLPPTLGSVGGRLGRMVQAEDAAVQPPGGDVDNDGQWGLATLEEDADRHYFASRTVLKSDSRDGEPLTLRFTHLKPGPYRAILSDPFRPATVRVAGRTVEATGGREVELGQVTVPVEVSITPAAPEPGNPGPVYVDYVRFLPIYDPAAPLPASDPQPTPRFDAGPVRFTVHNRSAARLVDTCFVGLPLPRGYLPRFEGEEMKLAGPISTLALWRDGSVKWLRLALRADLRPGQSQTFEFDPRRPGPRDYLSPALRTETAATDGLRAILPSYPTAGPAVLRLDCGGGPVEVTLDGGEVTVEESSIARIVRRWTRDVAVDGLPALKLACRSEVRWGWPTCGLSFGLLNASGKPIAIRSAELVLPIERAAGTAQVLRADAGRLWLDGAERDPADGWLSMDTGRGALVLGIRDMARRFACALFTDPVSGRATCGLWSGSAPYSFDPGSSMVQHLVLHASDAPQLAEVRAREILAPWLMPVEIQFDPEYLCSTGALGRLTPAGADPRFADFEQQVRTSFDIIRRDRSEDGLEHFGDVFQPGGYIAGTQRMWTNLEYDFVHATLTQWARTGETDYFTRALQAAHHFVDVDLIRWHSDASRIGGSFVHSHSMREGHHLEGPNFGHGGWPQGLLWAYYFTGDRDLLDGALGLGDYILKNIPAPENLAAVTPKYAMSEERDLGNALLTLSTVYEATGDGRYLDGARQVFDYAYRTQEPGLGAWGTPIHEYPPHRGTTFMIVMLYRALEAYDAVSGDPRVGEVMRAHIPWLLTAARDAQGRYPHKEWPPTSRSRASFCYYAEGYALAARFAGGPERQSLLALVLGDLLDIYSLRDRGCQLETDLDRPDRGRHLAPSGELGAWHDYTLDVRGGRVVYTVDGQPGWEGEFSGRSADEVRFWSGMNSRGTMLVDHVRIEGVAEPGGRRELLLDHGCETVAPFEAQPRSERNRVEAGNGEMRFSDADATYLGAAWKLPRPLGSYRIVWRQRFEPAMYGGFNVYGDGQELLHVGLGQGSANQAPFTNPRTFAPAVANLARLIGAAD